MSIPECRFLLRASLLPTYGWTLPTRQLLKLVADDVKARYICSHAILESHYSYRMSTRYHRISMILYWVLWGSRLVKGTRPHGSESSCKAIVCYTEKNSQVSVCCVTRGRSWKSMTLVERFMNYGYQYVSCQKALWSLSLYIWSSFYCSVFFSHMFTCFFLCICLTSHRSIVKYLRYLVSCILAR